MIVKIGDRVRFHNLVREVVDGKVTDVHPFHVAPVTVRADDGLIYRLPFEALIELLEVS